MLVLGLHFGHDASVALLRDGKIIYALEKERTSRVKHVIAVEADDVRAALDAVQLDISDVDCCAITNTQGLDYLFMDPGLLSFKPDRAAAAAIPSPYQMMLDTRQAYLQPSQPGPLAAVLALQRMGALEETNPFGSDPRSAVIKEMYIDYLGIRTGRSFDKVAAIHSTENFFFFLPWDECLTLPGIAQTSYAALIDPSFNKRFHLPMTVTIFGRDIPGAMFSHHYAHAAYSFYESEFESAGIISCDGAGGARWSYMSGMFYWGDGNQLYPMTPHYMSIGPLYDNVAIRFGLEAGKLMGLAAYGEPRLFDPAFVGNHFDEPAMPGRDKSALWVERAIGRADELGYDMAPLGDRSRMTERVNADIAASTQKCFEETMLRATESLAGCLTRTGVPSTRLCLTGGVMLNCPSNTRLLRESAFDEIFLPPAVNDSGLAVGACYALYHTVLNQPRRRDHPKPAELIYRAASYDPSTVERTIAAYRDRIVATRPADAAADAAGMLRDDAVIGWFEGASELGPRALGHRSILANPCFQANWARVNRIKGREPWRPLAPSVLAEKADAWFADGPMHSPHMLFNHAVIGDRLPAITHLDGTARVQTVDASNGGYYRLIGEFDKLTGVPVVLNTSFNGPGEPIVETPAHAIEFLLGRGLDAVFIGDWKVVAKA